MASNDNFYPNQLINMIKAGSNPQQLLLAVLQQQVSNTNNPMMSNLLELAKNNDVQAIENIARNLATQRGLNYDKQLSNFKSALGVK